MACFDENILAAVFGGELDERGKDDVDRHAAECAACRAVLAAYARAYAPTGTGAPAPGGAAIDLAPFAVLRAQKRVGTTLAGKWRLDELLGVGGSAQVLAATHRNGARVAVKILRPELALAGAPLTRFLREGYVANRVGHPGAVRVIDDDVDEGGTPFLVMDLLVGKNLRQIVARDGPRVPREVIRIGDRLLDVLASAHERGIVHRDVKPENVFATESGDVRVLDFGIARAGELAQEPTANATEMGTRIGTPAYMAPEQARGETDAVGPATDVWAAGATLFFLASGVDARRAPNREQELFFAMTKPAPALRSVRPDAPKPLADVIDRALAMEIGARWASAREMQQALRAAATRADGPLRARRRGAVMAVVALVGAVGVALALELAPRARARRVEEAPASAEPQAAVASAPVVGGPASASAPASAAPATSSARPVRTRPSEPPPRASAAVTPSQAPAAPSSSAPPAPSRDPLIRRN
jgi:serine/threonine-protein kinase